jgi:hypothetical protein
MVDAYGRGGTINIGYVYDNPVPTNTLRYPAAAAQT